MTILTTNLAATFEKAERRRIACRLSPPLNPNVAFVHLESAPSALVSLIAATNILYRNSLYQLFTVLRFTSRISLHAVVVMSAQKHRIICLFFHLISCISLTYIFLFLEILVKNLR